MSGFAQASNTAPTPAPITARLNRVANECRKIKDRLEGLRYQLGLGEPGDPQAKGETPPENLSEVTARLEGTIERIDGLLQMIHGAIV